MTNRQLLNLVAREFLTKGATVHTGPCGASLRHYTIGSVQFTPHIHGENGQKRILINATIKNPKGEIPERILEDSIDIEITDIDKDLMRINKFITIVGG